MSHQQIFNVWEPVSGTAKKMILKKLTDDNNGLTLWLKSISDERLLCVQFDAHIAYRNIDESYRSRTFDATGGFQYSLYRVENSKWLDWLHIESQHYYKNVEYIHYAIFTSADCIDVLSEFAPEVYWLEDDMTHEQALRV